METHTKCPLQFEYTQKWNERQNNYRVQTRKKCNTTMNNVDIFFDHHITYWYDDKLSSQSTNILQWIEQWLRVLLPQILLSSGLNSILPQCLWFNNAFSSWILVKEGNLQRVHPTRMSFKRHVEQCTSKNGRQWFQLWQKETTRGMC